MLLWPFYSTIVSEFDAPWQPLELFLDFIQILFLVQLWQIHNAEQMIMDDMEVNPDKYKDKKLTELTDDEDFDEENSVEYTKAYHKKALLPKMILVKHIPCGLRHKINLFMHFANIGARTLGRKQASKNLIWKLHLKSVRLVNLVLHVLSLLRPILV